MYITDSEPLRHLLQLQRKLEDYDLADKLQIRYYAKSSFHPKVFVFEGSKTIAAIIGSSNMTGGGTGENIEANISFEAPSGSNAARQIADFFDFHWRIDKLGGPEVLTRKKLATYSSAKLRFERTRPKAPKGRQLPQGKIKKSTRPNQDNETESIGWLLYHQKIRPDDWRTDKEFVQRLWKRYKSTVRKWHWPKRVSGDEGRRYVLILARDMEVYGHAVAELTYDIDSDARDERYKCAFRLQELYLLEKDGKKRMQLKSIVPKGKLTNLQGGPFKLSTRPWLIKNYEKLSGKKLNH